MGNSEKKGDSSGAVHPNASNASSAASLKSLIPDTQNKAWSSDTSRFGARMLAKMGWSEGKGLGAREDGATSHVRVAKRPDALGIGATTAQRGGEVALSSAIGEYDALLASLAAAAHVPTRKRARSESNASASGSVTAVPAAAPRGRIIARFARAGVLRQKNVAAYSSADLAAVLGKSVAEHAQGGAGSAVALPAAPALAVVYKSEGDRKREEKAARRAAKAAKAAAAAATASEEAPEPVEETEEERRERKRLRKAEKRARAEA